MFDEGNAQLSAVGFYNGMIGGGDSVGVGGGGAARVPGNFEPLFSRDPSDNKTKLSGVGHGFYPFGRLFYGRVNGPTVDSSAKIASGLIYLEVAHPTDGAPTATIKGAAAGGTWPAFSDPTDKTKSFIPLYEIADGAMTIDYRSCMSLPMREL